MKIYFDGVGLFTKPFLKKLLEKALKHLNQPSELLEMTLSIVSPEQIREDLRALGIAIPALKGEK